VDAHIEDGGYKRFYMHRTGHWLGMDVHDVGEYKVHDEWRLLEPGMVLTVEPGLYIGEADDIPKGFHDIGIRIEDDVLVTRDGHDVLSKDAPLADLFFGVDNTFLSRALEADIFEPYESPLLNKIPAEFRLDTSNRVLPVDYGDVCINYDKAYFSEKNLAVPQSLEDLTKPEYAGLLVVENPATSSPGLAFLLATVAHYGDSFTDYWQALKENGVVVVDGWETAYYTNFSASSGRGPQPMVVSYGSSPAAEVVYAEKKLDDAPTASILGPDTCFRQIGSSASHGTKTRPRRKVCGLYAG
jgi:ABC transporter substrate-binding protein (ThiB subfamily)